MKRYTIAMYAVAAFVVLLGLSVATAQVAPAPGSGIVGTFHDLSTKGLGKKWGDTNEQTGSLDRICIYCHAPHHTLNPNNLPVGYDNYDYLPLWNHDVTETLYSVYTNLSPDGPSSAPHKFNGFNSIGQPGGVSMLCLSCHDGTVATSAYGYAPADPKSIGSRDPSKKLVGRANLGGSDLTNDHPIGFNWSDVSEDNEIADATTTNLGSQKIGDLLWNGRMECTTCHDVHNTKNRGEKFLWESDKNSGLCLTCHLKGVLQ